AVSPDNTYWAVVYNASPYLTIYKWDSVAGTLTTLATPPGVVGPANAVAFSPSGTYLAIGVNGPGNEYLQLFKNNKNDTFNDITSAAPAGIDVQPGAQVNAVAFAPSDDYLAAADSTGSLTVYAYGGSDKYQKITGAPNPGGLTGLAFAPAASASATTY